MSEWWVNVSTAYGEAIPGCCWRNRADAVRTSAFSQFRIHVRLKPEGAPKRYADADQRFYWENIRNAGPAPGSVEWAVTQAARRASGQLEFHRRAADRLASPRTPKIEESAS